MAIARLIVCDWRGVHRHDTIVHDPAWSDVDSAIRALNNRNLNDIYLYPDASNAGTYLCVGGGAGRYIAGGCVDNEHFPALVDAHRAAEPTVTLAAGGQPGDYAANRVVDLQSALRAARSFYESGVFGPDVSWVST